MSTMLERRYRRQHLNCVRHITLDPKGRGVVRIHMIPPREDAENAPFLLLLNGSKLVPLNLSWAILLSCFMDRLEPFAGLEITESDWSAMAAGAVARTHKVYPFTPKERLAEDLQIMIESLVAIARGQEPEAEVAPLTPICVWCCWGPTAIGRIPSVSAASYAVISCVTSWPGSIPGAATVWTISVPSLSPAI